MLSILYYIFVLDNTYIISSFTLEVVGLFLIACTIFCSIVLLLCLSWPLLIKLFHISNNLIHSCIIIYLMISCCLLYGSSILRNIVQIIVQVSATKLEIFVKGFSSDWKNACFFLKKITRIIKQVMQTLERFVGCFNCAVVIALVYNTIILPVVLFSEVYNPLPTFSNLFFCTPELPN